MSKNTVTTFMTVSSVALVATLVLSIVALVKAFNANKMSFAGIANNLTWTQIGVTGNYTSSISVPGVGANALVQSTLSVPTSNVTDGTSAWLISSYTTQDTLYFIVAGNPSTPAQFPIAWTVFKY